MKTKFLQKHGDPDPYHSTEDSIASNTTTIKGDLREQSSSEELRRQQEQKPRRKLSQDQDEDERSQVGLEKRNNGAVLWDFKKRIPNSTSTEDSTATDRREQSSTQDLQQQRYRHHHSKRQHHADHQEGRHRHRHHHREHKKNKDYAPRFTTEASIRRVAKDVVKQQNILWQNQTQILRESLADQGKALSRIQRKLHKQQKWWAEVKDNDREMSRQHENQEKNLVEIRDELDDLQRVQELQEAAFRQMEIAQHDQEATEEKKRFDTFVELQDSATLSEFLLSLNLTNTDNMEVIRERNNTNIFIFPRTEASTSSRTDNTSELSVSKRHRQFLASK